MLDIYKSKSCLKPSILEVKPIALVNHEFSQRRQEIMGNLQTSLTEMEDDYNQIAQLTETLHYDRQTKTRVKQKVDELGTVHFNQ